MNNYTKNSIENMNKHSVSNKKDIDAKFQQLRKIKPKSLEKLFHEAHDKEFEKIDCLECANCCSGLGPILYNSDIDRIAPKLKTTSSKFIEKYLRIDEDGDYVYNSMPCPFLMPDNYCFIYEFRPKACREYPHTDRKRMHQILDKTKKNTSFCPAVFNIINSITK